MIIMPDSSLMKYVIMNAGDWVCKCSEVPAAALKKIRRIDKSYFELYGEHLIKFEEDYDAFNPTVDIMKNQ